MLLSLFVASTAYAGEFLIIPLNGTEVALEQSNAAVALSFVAGLFGQEANFDSNVMETAKPQVEKRLAERGVANTTEVKYFSTEYDAACFVGIGAPVRVQSFTLPAGSYWTLYVSTKGAVAWLGTVSGLTKKGIFEGFAEDGLRVAICPLR